MSMTKLVKTKKVDLEMLKVVMPVVLNSGVSVTKTIDAVWETGEKEVEKGPWLISENDCYLVHSQEGKFTLEDRSELIDRANWDKAIVVADYIPESLIEDNYILGINRESLQMLYYAMLRSEDARKLRRQAERAFEEIIPE